MPSSGVQTCARSEEHTSELQSHDNLVCRLLLEKKRGLFRSEEHTSELQSHDNLVCQLLLEKKPQCLPGEPAKLVLIPLGFQFADDHKWDHPLVCGKPRRRLRFLF